jgi:murein DD-endopeptidase MepM/ murein hydrolase activator NlpD
VLGLPHSRFAALLADWNGLAAAGFADWDFQPGTRFGELQAWWRAGGDRPRPHEGIDIGWFRTTDGKRRELGAGARVPTTWEGRVGAIVPDFLGSSVFVAHESVDAGGRRLLTVFGHVDPRPGLVPGEPVGAEDEIATIADARRRGSPVPAHLHLTVALFDPERLSGPPDWTVLGDAQLVTLVDPAPLLRRGR